MSLKWLLIFIAILLGALSAPARAEEACRLPDGWNSGVKPRTHFIIFGELHGTEQSPEMVGNVVCALSREGKRVLLGIELQATSNPGLQQAWAGPDKDFAQRLVEAMPGWSKRNDGVASRAMLAMLVRLHALKAAGRHIDVVAFNGMRDDAQAARFLHLPAQGPHEAAQAENIRLAAKAGHYDRVVVLVGSLHARKEPVKSYATGEFFKPMAMHLAPPEEIVSLRMSHEKGISWNCQSITVPGHPPGPIDCGPHKSPAYVPLAGAARLVSRSDVPASKRGRDGDQAYDGYFYVGPLTASAPVMGDVAPKR